MRSIKAGLLATLAIFLYCCNSHNFVENSQTDVDRSNIEFSALVEHNGSTTQTRKSGNDWTSGDAVGLFSFESGKPNSQATVDENVNNRKFITTTGDGIFSAEEGHIPYPAEKRDFISYFPFSNATAIKEDLTYSVDITNQNDINAIDLLYSNNLKNFDGSVKPELLFKHALARLDLTISSTKFSLKGAKVELVHLLSKADFNLVSQALLVDENSATNVTLPIKEVNGKLRAAALILPTGKAQDFSLKITLSDGQLVYWSKHKDKGWKWESGKIYTQEIQIGENGGVDPEPEPGDHFGFFETPQRAKQISNTQFVVHNVPSNSSQNIRFDANGNPQRNYTLLYDTKYKIAYWVAYPHHENYIGGTKRTNAWQYDPIVDTRDQINLKSSYKESYDRGHQIPSGDRTADKPLNQTTFYYTNMTAQVGPKMNQGIWARLEDHVRDYVKSHRDTVWVVTGAGLPDNVNEIKYAHSKSGEPSAIPTYYYKALAKKVGGKYYTKGYLLYNRDYNNQNGYEECAVPVKELEDKTGFTFFSSIPKEDKEIIVNSQW